MNLQDGDSLRIGKETDERYASFTVKKKYAEKKNNPKANVRE